MPMLHGNGSVLPFPPLTCTMITWKVNEIVTIQLTIPVHVSKSLNSANHSFTTMKFSDPPSSPSSARGLLIHHHIGTPILTHLCAFCCALTFQIPLYAGSFSSGTSNPSVSCSTAQPNTGRGEPRLGAQWR